MLVSIDLDILLLTGCSEVTKASVSSLLDSFLDITPSLSLLVLWDQSVPPTKLQSIQSWMESLGWGNDRCRWVAWRPVSAPTGPLRRMKTKTIRQTNLRLRLGLARWHGARAHIWLTTWPDVIAVSGQIPQGLAILADAWKPKRLQRELTRYKSRLLARRLNRYGAVAIDSASILKNLVNADDSTSWQSMINRLLSQAIDFGASRRSLTESSQVRSQLAWVTPMPPERTGIADYSALLIDEISLDYDVMVISDAPAPKRGKSRWRSTAWLHANGWRFDRICYHIGNSPFHRNIRESLDLWPGAVVLHEVYLGDLEYSFEAKMGDPNHRWLREIYNTHGYGALIGAQGPNQPQNHLKTYACNGSILNRALGVIVHSNHAIQLVAEQAGPASSLIIEQVPMARMFRSLPERSTARRTLGLDDDDVLICSFGIPGANKLSREIAESWGQVMQDQDFHSTLTFVGGSSSDPYVADLETVLKGFPYGTCASISGWVDPQIYANYLAACDIAIQLRATSRGETSAAVLDCLCSGIPTIVNSIGSLAELSEDTVLMLPTAPNHNEIAGAIRTLGLDKERRRAIAERAALLQKKHLPSVCANVYRESIENIYAGRRASEEITLKSIGSTLPTLGVDRVEISQVIAQNFPRSDGLRQLFVDVSAIFRSDYKTGVQRVVRALILEFLLIGINGYRVEPVWLSSAGGRWHYRYARAWTCKLLGLEAPELEDQAIEFSRGDILLIADLTCGYLLESERCGILPTLIEKGVQIQAIIYDILPIQLPQYFPNGTDNSHGEWLSLLTKRATNLLCISQSVANDTKSWIEANHPENLERLRINWFHLGADLENSDPTMGMPVDLEILKKRLMQRCTFLMVGTIEPRKGYAQVVGAFEQLLKEGHPFNIVIIGKVGWMMEGLIHHLTTHSKFGNGIFWYESASDEFLRWLYQHCDCLIAASEGEGFGLPLIEAALHDMPLLVRDLPVFREVAGDGAMYFTGTTPDNLASAIIKWHRRFKESSHPNSSSITWQTWNQSAKQLLEKMRLGDST